MIDFFCNTVWFSIGSTDFFGEDLFLLITFLAALVFCAMYFLSRKFNQKKIEVLQERCRKAEEERNGKQNTLTKIMNDNKKLESDVINLNGEIHDKQLYIDELTDNVNKLEEQIKELKKKKTSTTEIKPTEKKTTTKKKTV